MTIEINLCNDTVEALNTLRNDLSYDSLDEVILFLVVNYIMNKEKKQ